MEPVTIVTAPDADELQGFAASELQTYIRRLFGIEARMGPGAVALDAAHFLVGLVTDPHLREACPDLPVLSDQGHLVRRVDEHTMVLAGGSSAAAAWAVYELVEEWGVTYLLHGDALPEGPGAFHLPAIDRLLEPVLELRCWRQINDLPTGPILWTLEQHQAFLRQIFKLKYNAVHLSLWPQHPFVDYEFEGVRKQTACLLFGQQIPIDGDNIGRELLPDAPFLDNPEMLGATTYDEKLAAGRRLLGGLIDRARFFDMHTSLSVQPLEFPAEFRPVLEQPTEGPIQLGGLTCAERGDLTNPGHLGLTEAKLNAYLDQWSQVDEIFLGLPEHPQAERTFKQCWQELDARYGLERTCSLDELLAEASRNYLVAGGLERAQREFKASISMLHFFDRFFAGNDVLQRAADRNTGLSLNLGGNCEPLFPVLEQVLWPGAGVATSMGYTSSRAVRSMHAMENLDVSAVPAALVITLQDDNVGSLPQVATGNIHLLVQNMQRLGWRGFLTRYWPIGDLDPPAAYLAQASWDRRVTPDAAYLRHCARVYGEAAVPEMRAVMRLLEDATVILDLDFLSLFFPVLGIVSGGMEGNAPMPEGLFHVRAMYEQAQRLLARAEGKVTGEAGRAELAYWRSRLEFGVQALIEKDLLHEGGMALNAARGAQDEPARGEHLAAARKAYQAAVEAGERALRATASQVRDDSDRTTLAAYYHFMVREVRERAAELLGDDA